MVRPLAEYESAPDKIIHLMRLLKFGYDRVAGVSGTFLLFISVKCATTMTLCQTKLCTYLGILTKLKPASFFCWRRKEIDPQITSDYTNLSSCMHACWTQCLTPQYVFVITFTQI